MSIFEKMATSPLFNPQPIIKAGQEEAFLQAAGAAWWATDRKAAVAQVVAAFVEVK